MIIFDNSFVDPWGNIRPIAGTSIATLEVGKPDVPAFGKWILIPNGAKPVLDVSPGVPVVYENLDIPPVQPPPIDSATAPFHKGATTYAIDTNYPRTSRTPGARSEVSPDSEFSRVRPSPSRGTGADAHQSHVWGHAFFISPIRWFWRRSLI